MYEAYRKILALLGSREKRIFFLLIGVMIFTAFSEIIGLSLFMALLGILAQPEAITDNAFLSNLYARFGFTSIFGFQLAMSLVVAVAIILGLIIKAASAYFVTHFVLMAGRNLSLRMLRAYLAQPYSWSLNRSTVDMTRKLLAECEQLIQKVAKPALGILASFLLVISIVIFLIVVEPQVALISFFLLGGGYGLAYLIVRHRLQRYGAEMVTANRERYRVTLEMASGFKDVKLAGLEDIYTAEFDEPSLRRAKYSIRSQILREIPRFALEGLTFTILLVMVLVLLVRNDGNLLAAIPTMGVFAFAVMRMLPALQQVYNGFASLRSGAAVIDLIYDDFLSVRHVEADVKPVDRVSKLNLREDLVFDDVSYSYPKAQKVALRGLSATIKANSIIGIVGGTGAGKTTFVDLLLGLLSPDSGRITVDESSLEGANVRAWQNTIGYVPQQIFLTHDSVAANIAFGVPKKDVDMAAVERAAKAAVLHDFVVNDLPEGYGTSIGDRGVRLSGGQRQRIGIARALYHDPSILILDEATSALDNITEQSVMQAVQNLQGQKTIVMIAHRLSTVESCDDILLMENGEIVASGTFAELAETNRTFQKMLGSAALRAS
ncbi:MAG: ABC transporter ATP-binding protein [Tateyamaria sp.]|uniref:ABC transporter ATP-binding protein n=3 Tax=Tateyamaria sp. TaxID=1929288 RepID=UPI00329D28EE